MSKAPLGKAEGTGKRVLRGLTLFMMIGALSPLSSIPRAAHADTTWQGVNNGLFGGRVYSLGVSPGYATDQTLFAGTFGGVFRSTDVGGAWSQVNAGLTSTNVLSLGMSPGYATDQTLFAGTSGGGVFRSSAAVPTPTATPTPVPGVSQLGLVAMAAAFLATFVWSALRRRRQRYGDLHK